MTGISRFAVAAAVLWTLLGAGSASADTITIASGSLDVFVEQGGPTTMSLTGNSEGFSLQGGLSPTLGGFQPFNQCGSRRRS